MLFIIRYIFCISVVASASCGSIVEFEKYTIADETQGARLSYEDLSSHTPVAGDSIMFEMDAEKLKKHIAQNKAVWVHFVYSTVCADAELYDCEMYKELNEKYRDKISYVMISEIAHSKFARILKNECNLVGYHTFVVDNNRVHNERRALKKLKKEVFGFSNKDTLLFQTNYIIIDNQIVYASDHTLDRKKIQVILDKL
jgi:thiol-disulfide isomerase/thioredoxin